MKLINKIQELSYPLIKLMHFINFDLTTLIHLMNSSNLSDEMTSNNLGF